MTHDPECICSVCKVRWEPCRMCDGVIVVTGPRMSVERALQIHQQSTRHLQARIDQMWREGYTIRE